MATEERITLIGCGPGAREYVTPAARAACAAADVAVGSPGVFELLPECPERRIVMGNDVEAVLSEVEALPKDTRIAVLVTGDPGVFSLASAFVKRFGAERCEIIPGISSVQVAFGRLGVSWAGAKILSAHHRRPETGGDLFRGADRVAILAGAAASFGWIADLMNELPDEWTVYACEDLTLDTEKVSRVAPGDLRRGGFSSRTVVLALRNELLP